ncbi:MAG: PAS domain-containing protein [Akkermansiaceae bacterium]|nr:PAS domain-containing protein [Akkermansiaceae bacterium]
MKEPSKSNRSPRANFENSNSAKAEGSVPQMRFPIVGIGASAGGLAAFEAFFSNFPKDHATGMAFVVIQHLSPDHQSSLAALIQRTTQMNVFEAEDGMVVQPDCIYTIPPHHDLEISRGYLLLIEPPKNRSDHLPLDLFLKSLAEEQKSLSIAVILSGNGADGSLGIRRIKDEGGMVMAQDPASTKFDSMPRCAIDTALVDTILSPAEMPTQLLAYVADAEHRHVGSEAKLPPKKLNELRKIFMVLRANVGHDFSQYKSSTIHRRIDRRMVVNGIETLEDYSKYLQQTPKEAEALFHDLLIGVTKFFRDPEAFEELQKSTLSRLVSSKLPGDTIRIWVTGCSTGEEAYSLAILLSESMEAQQQFHAVQIFATDIDPRAIAIARAGLYSSAIADDMTPERLAHYFTEEPHEMGFRIKKCVRDFLVFSEHNLIKDPPFSRMDLISCRNLLIYLGAELQKKIIPLFHYSLRQDGSLFLGNSEGIGEFGNLFRSTNQKSKIYQRKGDAPLPRTVLNQFLPMYHDDTTETTMAPKHPNRVPKLPLRDITEQGILAKLAPAAALVNHQGDILYLHGQIGRFLEIPPGEIASANILKMARDGLRPSIATALRKTITTGEQVHYAGIQLKIDRIDWILNLMVFPITNELLGKSDAPLYLILIEEIKGGIHVSTEVGTQEGSDVQGVIARIREELQTKDDQLQSMTEELESSSEELRSSNEEMQSVNEELQSTNEELETSKEELQSVNEELSTVNMELNAKVADLTKANNDMNNLLAGTGVGTVFVDHQLRVMRFTPAASNVINLIASDIGRPIAHIASNLLHYDALIPDVQSVLDTLIPKDQELMAKNGHWYSMHIQPYRTLDNVIEGAVISFMHITEKVKMQEKLRGADEQLRRLAAVVRNSNDAIIVQDLSGQILAWNPGATRLYGWTESEALQMNLCDRIPDKRMLNSELTRLEDLSMPSALILHETNRLTKDGTVLCVALIATALLGADGKLDGIVTTERLMLS